MKLYLKTWITDDSNVLLNKHNVKYRAMEYGWLYLLKRTISFRSYMKKGYIKIKKV
jgi:hypothetical protein